MVDRVDNQDWQKQDEDTRDAIIRDSLARITVGMGGKREAEILASALGDRFTEKRSEA